MQDGWCEVQPTVCGPIHPLYRAWLVSGTQALITPSLPAPFSKTPPYLRNFPSERFQDNPFGLSPEGDA